MQDVWHHLSNPGIMQERAVPYPDNDNSIFFGNRETGGHKNQPKAISVPFSAEYGGVAAINVNEWSRASEEEHPLLWRQDESLL